MPDQYKGVRTEFAEKFAIDNSEKPLNLVKRFGDSRWEKTDLDEIADFFIEKMRQREEEVVGGVKNLKSFKGGGVGKETDIYCGGFEDCRKEVLSLLSTPPVGERGCCKWCYISDDSPSGGFTVTGKCCKPDCPCHSGKKCCEKCWKNPPHPRDCKTCNGEGCYPAQCIDKDCKCHSEKKWHDPKCPFYKNFRHDGANLKSCDFCWPLNSDKNEVSARADRVDESLKRRFSSDNR